MGHVFLFYEHYYSEIRDIRFLGHTFSAFFFTPIWRRLCATILIYLTVSTFSFLISLNFFELPAERTACETALGWKKRNRIIQFVIFFISIREELAEFLVRLRQIRKEKKSYGTQSIGIIFNFVRYL